MVYAASQIYRTATVKAIYYLYRDGTLVYIGKTKNLRRRLTEHTLLKEFDSFTYTDVATYENYSSFEAAALDAYYARNNRLPELNQRLERLR